MGSIERNTCLRFRKRSNERDYVDIRNEHDEGCYVSYYILIHSNSNYIFIDFGWEESREEHCHAGK
jgi:hypothetical protein